MELSYPKNSFSSFKTIGLVEVSAYSTFPSPTRATHAAFAMTFSLIFNQLDFGERGGVMPWVRSLHQHDHFAFASTVEFAEKNSLPASEQQFSITERYGNTGTDEAGFDMSVGVFFAMMKTHPVLRNQSSERVQHVARHVGIGILVHCQTGGRMLDIKDHNALARA